MEVRRYCLTCDLKDDSILIEKYKSFHAQGKVWPEIIQSIKDSGILNMEIYLIGNRMFMILEVSKDFDFNKKAQMDSKNPKVKEWETLMSTFQKPVEWSRNNEKWLKMGRIFKLN